MLQCGMGIIMCPIAFILTMGKKAMVSKQAEYMVGFFKKNLKFKPFSHNNGLKSNSLKTSWIYGGGIFNKI